MVALEAKLPVGYEVMYNSGQVSRGYMKIIEVTYNYPAEVFIQRHLQALQASQDMDVQLVARHGIEADDLSASIGGQRQGISALVMPNFDHLSRLGQLLSLRYLLLARRWFREGGRSLRHQVLVSFFDQLKPDLIHFQFTSLAVLMRWIPEALGIPYTVSVRGSDVQVFPLRSQNDALETAEALEGAAGIHTVCVQLGELSSELVGHPLAYTPIYTTVPLPDTLGPYEPMSEASNGLHFVAIGRFHWRKQFPALLVAIKALLEQGVNAHLTLVGSGEDEDSIRYWRKYLELQSAVTLTGKLKYEEICDLLKRSHAFVQSSIAEGFSNATAEAMALGCPVFATDVGGTAEIIEDGENGFLLPPTEPKAWAEKLVLAQDQALMGRIRATAYETACAEFCQNRHVNKFIYFYKGVIE